MRFVHTPNAICATTETGRVSGAILKRPPEWAESLWDRLAPQVCELLSAQPRGVTCADLITQGYLQPLRRPEHANPGDDRDAAFADPANWREGDTVRFTGRTGQWYVHGNEYTVGSEGQALLPGSRKGCKGLQITTEPGHYCTWPLNSLAHKFEWVR